MTNASFEPSHNEDKDAPSPVNQYKAVSGDKEVLLAGEEASNITGTEPEDKEPVRATELTKGDTIAINGDAASREAEFRRQNEINAIRSSNKPGDAPGPLAPETYVPDQDPDSASANDYGAMDSNFQSDPSKPKADRAAASISTTLSHAANMGEQFSSAFEDLRRHAERAQHAITDGHHETAMRAVKVMRGIIENHLNSLRTDPKVATGGIHAGSTLVGGNVDHDQKRDWSRDRINPTDGYPNNQLI